MSNLNYAATPVLSEIETLIKKSCSWGIENQTEDQVGRHVFDAVHAINNGNLPETQSLAVILDHETASVFVRAGFVDVTVIVPSISASARKIAEIAGFKIMDLATIKKNKIKFNMIAAHDIMNEPKLSVGRPFTKHVRKMLSK